MQPRKYWQSLLADSLRAHALLFGTPLSPKYGVAIGTRMLIAFAAVAVGLFYLLRSLFSAAGWLDAPGAKLGFVAALIAAFLVTQRSYIRLPESGIGLRPLSDWTRRERLYFFQVAPLAAVIFVILFHAHLLALSERYGVAGFLLFSVLTGVLWGMLQEFLYRGWLQTELSRRFGLVAGLLAANLLYTFGPLHFNYFFDASGVRWGGFAAVFGIGLLFGAIYARSGNLWIPAVLHGLWPPNMS